MMKMNLKIDKKAQSILKLDFRDENRAKITYTRGIDDCTLRMENHVELQEAEEGDDSC